VVEAMAVGLPVVGYDIPSSTEVFGDAILRIAQFEIDAFAMRLCCSLPNGASAPTTTRAD